MLPDSAGATEDSETLARPVLLTTERLTGDQVRTVQLSWPAQLHKVRVTVRCQTYNDGIKQNNSNISKIMFKFLMKPEHDDDEQTQLQHWQSEAQSWLETEELSENSS